MRPKTENRKPKTENRKPKTVSRLASAVVWGISIVSTALPSVYSFTEVNQNWTLDSDFRGSLRIQGVTAPGRFPIVNLNGHTAIIDSEGIVINPGTRDAQLSGGILTSSESILNIRFLTHQISGYNYVVMDLVISDSVHQVGLWITGNEAEDSGLYLEGNQSNTFTGNVEISGRRKHLSLRKSNGAIAIRSDILVRNQAILRFENSNQLLKSSSVTLKMHGVLQTLAGRGGDITNTFKNLTIEDNGVIHFNHEEGNSANSKYYIKIDNILINRIGHLEIRGWQDGRDFLLVRKNSSTLSDALTKMAFAGYDPNNIHLEDFNAEYWSISATPESATYGAIVGAVGLGLVVWRKQRRSPKEVPRKRKSSQATRAGYTVETRLRATSLPPECEWKCGTHREVNGRGHWPLTDRHRLGCRS